MCLCCKQDHLLLVNNEGCSVAELFIRKLRNIPEFSFFTFPFVMHVLLKVTHTYTLYQATTRTLLLRDPTCVWFGPLCSIMNFPCLWTHIKNQDKTIAKKWEGSGVTIPPSLCHSSQCGNCCLCVMFCSLFVMCFCYCFVFIFTSPPISMVFIFAYFLLLVLYIYFIYISFSCSWLLYDLVSYFSPS